MSEHPKGSTPAERVREVESLAETGQLERAVLLALRLAVDVDDRALVEAARQLAARFERDKHPDTQRAIRESLFGLCRRIVAAQLPASAALGATVLRCRGLAKTRTQTFPPFQLKDVDLDLRLGEITALIGANGHGKSTLLEVVAGRVEADDGEMTFFDGRLNRLDDWPSIKRRLGYIPQGGQNRERATVEVSLRYIAAIYGARGDQNDFEVELLLTSLGIEKYRHTPVSMLSAGYQTRYALAAALIKRPSILILDEPLAHLDRNAQLRFLDDVRNLSSSTRTPMAVLISSQHLHEIEAVSHYTLFLRDGRPRYYGPTNAFQAVVDHDVFEIGVPDVSRNDLVLMLSALSPVKIEQTGPSFLVTIPTDIGATALVDCLAKQSVRLIYLRDVGRSTRMLLAEDR
jgi:ABC-2 type transport system ATP-binding protein